jgi:hypothetical protein
MRRLVAGSSVAASDSAHGEDGHPEPDRDRRDGPGEKDPSRVAQLTPRRVADRGDEVPDRPATRQPRGQASLET